ncbi:NAD(P)-binding protein [Zopfia rhizophila CBS 207.26]|uniref:NAD(P)-binding protein n=1 Tax=Zopfia rhizophila CBS 207.26 TaxID=1314779 RepID=A0A6A6EJN9_9PEZI|nr:NAD(P)-binding protein [Zopfia rhizophila CBS 207.26]
MATPIRVGFIGLSTQPFPQGWTCATHLPYLKANPEKYQITAVLNSTLQSSQKAIQQFSLDSAQPLADLESFVSSSDIDLVVIGVEVAQHHRFAKAALEHGKEVFCEWPLTKNSAEMKELIAIAEAKGVKTYTCLETPLLPVVSKLREVLSSGRIGEVIATNLYACLPPTGPAWNEHAIFYLDIQSGQSPLHCRVAHPIEAFCRTLGEFESFKSILSTHQRSIRVYDVPVAELGEVMKDPEAKPYRIVERTAPDMILVQGKLVGGVVAGLHFSTGAGQTDADGRNLRWIISGTEGDIQVTQTQGPLLRDFSVEIKAVRGGETEKFAVDWEEKGEYGMFGEHVMLATPGRHYKAIAEGAQDGIVSFKDGLRRHEMLEQIVAGGK